MDNQNNETMNTPNEHLQAVSPTTNEKFDITVADVGITNTAVKKNKISLIIFVIVGVVVAIGLIVGSIIIFGHKHEFTRATCTTPKICKECGISEGHPLYHTTSLGKCKNCGELQNIDLLKKINQKIEAAGQYWDEGLQKTKSNISKLGYNDEYIVKLGCDVAINYLEKAQEIYEEVYILCGSYPELKELRSSLRKITSFKFSYVDDTVYSINSHADEVIEFGNYVVAMMEEFNAILN